MHICVRSLYFFKQEATNSLGLFVIILSEVLLKIKQILSWLFVSSMHPYEPTFKQQKKDELL